MPHICPFLSLFLSHTHKYSHVVVVYLLTLHFPLIKVLVSVLVIYIQNNCIRTLLLLLLLLLLQTFSEKMGSSQVCFCWHKYRQLILYLLILFAPTSVFTHNAFMAEGRPISGLIKADKKGVKVQGEAISKNAKIGSRPPKCERRCRICGHCEAVQVPVVPQVQSHLSHSAVSETPNIANSRTDDLSNYKPMSWKCKCGDYFFNP